MKLVDVLDSKSCVGNHVPVRVRPSANKKNSKRSSFYLLQIFIKSVGFISCILSSGLVITDGAIILGNWHY